MKTIFGLSYLAVLPVVATVILYLLDKKTSFGTISKKRKQIYYGLVFGGLAILGNEYGVDIGGAMANTRDASVLTAGLLFGAPAGVISGLLGGIERYLCVYWGGGTYTQVACSISTICSGIFGAILRKYMFDDKKPTVPYALGIGLVAEVMHMLMIFITNMSDIATGFEVVKKCALPMILVNGLSVMISVLVVTLLSKEKLSRKEKRKHLSVVAQQWLLVCVVFAFILTCLFTSVLQFRISDNNTNEILELNLDDVVSEISDTSDRNLLEVAKRVASEFSENDLDTIADIYHVAEINRVDKNGIIIQSTNPSYIGFDMGSGEQSAEFLCLLHGSTSLVQKYQPIAYDASISMKYAGVALGDGTFLQVAYTAEQFQKDISKEIVNMATNRHVEKTGYLFIADTDFNIVSVNGGWSVDNQLGVTIDGQTIKPNASFSTNIREGERFKATIYGEETYCMCRICEGYYVVAVLPIKEANFVRDLSVYMMVFMEIVIFVGLFILIYFLIKRLVVDNILSVNSSLAQISDGNLNVVVNVRSNEEFASLSDDINATVETLKQYIAEAAARIDKELMLAKVIQESSLPSAFPAFPDRNDLDVYALMDTAKEVGGDFYDFYLLDDNHLAFLIADVSGKGITGAMFMMKAKTVIKSFAERGGSVADILTKANNALCEGNDAEMFVTCFMGILDLQKNVIEFASAGHNPPLVRHKDGKFEYFKSKPGLVLGGMENVRYRKGIIDFQQGDSIFLYTDGVTEATDSNNELYGEDRLYQILDTVEKRTAVRICHTVKKDVEAFVKDAPQFDDITMLCIQYIVPGQERSGPEMKEITVEAAIENISKVTEFVDQQLEALNCSMKIQTQIDIAIDELFGNIAMYAYNPEIGKATVRVEVENDPLAVIITFLDNGIPYDPLAKADPDVTLSAEDREIGGLGIFLVKKSMDDISYEYKDGQNILTIKKNI